MKTAIKITALAVITILSVLSCTQEVELSSRDWKGPNLKFDNTYTDLSDEGVPAFGGKTTITTPKATDRDLELDIDFPNLADFLRPKNITTASLTKFMSIYVYTDNTTGKHPSVLGVTVPYEYVRRQLMGNYTRVTIKVDSLSSGKAVIKIDATKYTFAGGKKMDRNNDMIAGQAIYDDVYQAININGGGVGFVAKGLGAAQSYGSSLTLSINAFAIPSPTNIVGEKTINVASVSGFDTALTDYASVRDAITPLLAGKFKFQKYNASKDDWDTATGTIAQNPGTPDIQLKFTADNLGIYRIKAEGLEQLTISEYWEAKQKIKVAYPGIPATFLRKVIETNFVYCIDGGNDYTTSSIPFNAASYYKSDSQGRNVVLYLVVNSLSVGGNPYYLPTSAPSLSEFKKNFKIAYSTSDSILNSVAAIQAANDVQYIDIKGVKYGISNRIPGANTNEIEITLDPSYRINNAGTRYLFVAPGFKYNTEKLLFGDYDNLTYVVDGAHFFKFNSILPFAF